MENPATWKRAENVILEAYNEWNATNDAGRALPYRASLPSYIATCLREQGILRDEDEPAVGASFVKWKT